MMGAQNYENFVQKLLSFNKINELAAKNLREAIMYQKKDSKPRFSMLPAKKKNEFKQQVMYNNRNN
jgi:hypothetical protein